MALTPEQITNLWDAHTVPVFGKTGINPIVFARAIEAEVQKQDTALIRQLRDVLVVSSPNTDRDYGWDPRVWVTHRDSAISAASARLAETLNIVKDGHGNGN